MGERVISCQIAEEWIERLDRLCSDMNECVKANYYFRSSLMAQMIKEGILSTEELMYGKLEQLPQRPLKHILKSVEETRAELPEFKPVRLDL